MTDQRWTLSGRPSKRSSSSAALLAIGRPDSFLCSCRSSEDSAVVGEEEEAHRRWEAKLVQAVDKSKASRQRLVEQQGLEEVPEQPETDSPFVAVRRRYTVR